MKPITVLSLFDGISCGQQALKELKIPVKKYYASEVHLPSMQVTRKNFPETKFIGDVTLIKAKYLDKIDLLIGGSPCQGFSFNGKQLNFEDPRSKLFFEYARLLKEAQKINPKVLFLLENVRMQKDSERIISDILKVEPILINSELFGAQKRPRLYWTNISISNPPLKNHLVVNDILLSVPSYTEEDRPRRNRRGHDSFKSRDIVVLPYKKAPCLLSGHGPIHVATSFKTCRILHPIEWERLQGLPDDYTKGVSERERYMTIGNGWHVPTVKFLLNHINK